MIPDNFSIIYATPKLLMILNGEICIVSYVVIQSKLPCSVFYLVRKHIHCPRVDSTYMNIYIDGDCIHDSDLDKRISQANKLYESDKYNDIRKIIFKRGVKWHLLKILQLFIQPLSY